MADTSARLLYLYDRFINDTATQEEVQEFFRLYAASPEDEILHQAIFKKYHDTRAEEVEEIDWSAATQKIFRTKRRRARILYTTWIRYAAAAVLVLSFGAYLWNIQKEKPSVATTTRDPYPVKTDLPPGGNRATLILADGSKIMLDSAKAGQLAQQSGARISKSGEQVVYSQDRKLSLSSHSFNTLVTPRGGQYQLTLPDGTRVWLNAASSIMYPTTFASNEKERRVTVTGEAYFEVAKNKSKPFIVAVATVPHDKPAYTVEVLGTHFNVNAYANEPGVSTTLLEGSVKIKAAANSIILQPNQQGQLRSGTLTLNRDVDAAQVVAWKDGYFRFDNEDLSAIMRQVERWYDVEVIFQDPISEKLVANIRRDVSLTQFLQLLELTNLVHFKVEGRKIIVHK